MHKRHTQGHCTACHFRLLIQTSVFKTQLKVLMSMFFKRIANVVQCLMEIR